MAGVGVRSARPVLLDQSVEQDLTVQRIEITGASLLQVLEWNLAGLCPDQSCDPPEFFQVGGARLDLVVREDNAGSRLTRVEVRQ